MGQATETRAAKFRVLGSNDDASDCCCCGRQGLKMVVWLQPLDEDGEDCGSPVHFGRACAAKAAGWGYGTRSAIDARLNREAKAAWKHYAAAASKRIADMRDDGRIEQVRVACGFDIKSGSWSYGYIFALPGDVIGRISDPHSQQAEIRDAKARRNAAYPICRWFDERLTTFEIRAMLA